MGVCSSSHFAAGGSNDPMYMGTFHVTTIDQCEERCNEDYECTAFSWYGDDMFAGDVDNCFITHTTDYVYGYEDSDVRYCYIKNHSSNGYVVGDNY